MSDSGMWTPKSESKLEGFGRGAGEALDPSMISDTDMIDFVGERLPLAPKPAPPDSLRPTSHLMRQPSLQRTLPKSDDAMLALARQCYSTSENYFNASHRTRVMDAMARFNNEHPKGSKYWSTAYERRSRLFRPKTRSIVRSREAAAAISMFASSDIVSVTATQGTQQSAMDARIQEYLLNYRVQQDDRWYRLVIGAIQDAERQGFVIGKTYWDYEEANQYYDEQHPTLGAIKRVDTVATKDRPGYSLIPMENFRFSPASDWMDVVASSPFLIEVIPMYICDIRKYESNPEAKLRYRHLSDGQLLSGGHASEWDAIRMQRERNKLNRYDRQGEPNDYAVCWVHRNIVRIEGEDYIFDSIGGVAVLSDIIPLSEFEPRGYRPYVIGSTLIESHNPYNVGGVSLMAPLQDEVNEVGNLRIDATKMAISGRMFLKRGTGLDLNALAKFSPGATVEMDNPAQDVKWDRSPEPPQGAYEENKLLSTEIDDLMGGFSQTTAANNRELENTVGGMQMLNNAATQITEYDLHTIVKTFFGKMLNHVLDLEKQWETDGSLAAIIGQKMGSTARGFWKALGTDSKVTVNVGFGATNPQKRIERLTLAFGTAAKLFPSAMMNADQDEVIREIFGSAGYPDAVRFFPSMEKNQSQDPQVRSLQAQVQQLQQQLNPVMQKMQAAKELQDAKIQGQLQIQQLSNQSAIQLKHMELQMAYIELQLKHESNDIARGQLMLARERLSNDIAIQRQELVLQIATAQASANPPQIPLPADSSQEVANLQQPGSNVPMQTFPQDVESAGQYATQALQPTPSTQPGANA